MPKEYFKIFKDSSDHYCWDKHIEYYEKTNEIDDDEKRKLVYSIKYLKTLFSKDFLKNSKSHYISSLLLNRTEFCRKEIIWMVQSLKSFENNPESYKLLKNKLIDPNVLTKEGIPFLEIGSFFINNGFEVFFEPEIVNFKKKPDILIIENKRKDKIYIEVSTLNQSETISIRRSNYYKISDILSRNNVRFSGKIYKEIDYKEIELIKSKIRKLVTTCRENNSIEYLRLDETNQSIELAIAPHSRLDDLKLWVYKKNYKIETLESLGLDYAKYTYRITSNKIKKEIQQIPKNETGLIILKIEPIYLLTVNINEAINKIKKKIENYPNLIGLFIISNIVDATDDFETENNKDYYGSFSMFGVNKRLVLYVNNELYNNKINYKTKNKIIKMFKKTNINST